VVSRTLLVVLLGALAATWWPACAGRSCGGEIPRAADAPRHHRPEESLKYFQLPKGFRLEIVASEPHVADPVAMAFDAKGRIFVCEIHGYNLEGHLDVTELNKTGVLDKAVRRIPANPEARRLAEENQYGTVKLLEDTDGDGRVDACTVWADRLLSCYGVVPARAGVIVLCAPDIIYLADHDGDGKAEIRETLFTGFGVYDMWSRINNPRWGLDNWIYAAGGIQSGGTIRGANLPGEVKIGATCFRFKPDGSAFEPCSGGTSGFGLAISDWGDRFLVTNQQHALYVAPLPHRYLARNPYYSAPQPVVNISSYGHPAPVYPTSQPHPWRLARSKQPEWVKFYGAAEATANGFFTAASGQVIYQGAAFGDEYYGNHFSVDNAQNMIHRCLLVRDGAGYTVKRAPGEEEVEFLTSTEQWFRPVNLETGPDGALYIVDMYREIIEDYSAIPRYLQQQYGLIEGSDRGRIWRIVAEGAPKPRKLDLAGASTERLVRELSNRNVQWRKTAQRLLVERGDKSAVAALAALVRKGKTPQGRLHALYTLDGLDSLEPALVEEALDDSHFAVRMHALRLAERWFDTHPALIQKALRLAEDQDPKVRLQSALSLGASEDEREVRALSQLAAGYGSHPWMQAAILSSVADTAGELLQEIIERPGDSSEARWLLHPIASIVGARHNNQEIGNLLATITEAQGRDPASLQVSCLKGLIEGLKRGKPQVLAARAGQSALRRLLVSPSAQVRELALRAAGLVKLQETPEMKEALATAGKVALDEGRTIEDRQAAVGLLVGAPYALLGPTAGELLNARQPLDLQLAAIGALSSVDDPQIVSFLLANFDSYTPKVQTAVINAVFSRQNRLPKLLDAIQEGVVRLSCLDAIRRVQLSENPDAEIRRRAGALLAGQGPGKGRDEVLARYQAALAGPRDTKRGKEVFDEQCAKCHKLQGQGFEVGPDLATVSTRADETLISDILDPSNQLTVGYRNYTVITEDGRIFTGVLAAETATGIVLRREEAAEDTILRKDIDEMAASGQSMMPEELDKEVSPKDLVDLIGYLREVLGPLLPSAVTLFDDERSFAEILSEGEGTVAIRTDDCFSGAASLAVTPPQCWSLRIPGWEYPIVENPALGQFRYLRFAWKSRGGQGVMIELAADGKWPPAEKPLRRYYAGKNTTDWQALEVSPQVPTQWVVVTRDLWQDFGPFTLTGIAPTAMGGEALFDRIQLLRTLDDLKPAQ